MAKRQEKGYEAEGRYERMRFHNWTAEDYAVSLKRLKAQEKEREKYEKWLEKREGKTLSIPQIDWWFKMKGYKKKGKIG